MPDDRDDSDPPPPEGYEVDYEGCVDEAWAAYLEAMRACEEVRP